MDSYLSGYPREAVPPTEDAFKWLKSSYRRHGAWHQWIVSMQKVDAALLLLLLARPSMDANVGIPFLLGALMMFSAAEKLVAAIGIGFDNWHKLSDADLAAGSDRGLPAKLFEQRKRLWLYWNLGRILTCVAPLPFLMSVLPVPQIVHSVFIVSLAVLVTREGIFTPKVFD